LAKAPAQVVEGLKKQEAETRLLLEKARAALDNLNKGEISMSCDCAQCRQHYRTLGIAYGMPSESEIEEAYREGVKQWHPDLYENYASLRADAEEHFKQIQVAYRELKEHSGAPEESPAVSIPTVNIPTARTPVERSPVDSFFTQPRSVQEAPAISFGGAPGCLVASQFTTGIEEIIARHLGKIDTPLAIVDLGGARSYAASYSHFLSLDCPRNHVA
jgi:hypothetical protein